MLTLLIKHRRPIMVVVDAALVNSALFLAYMLRFDWQLTPELISSLVFFMMCTSAIRIVLFALFGMYQWSFRFASISEALNVVKAATLGSMLLVTIAFFTRSLVIGRSVLLIDYLFCLFFIGVSRFLVRILVKFNQAHHIGLKRVLIAGAGSAGEMVARELTGMENRIYQPVGFVDDDSSKKNSRIHGIKILGTTDDITTIAKEYGIEEMIIAMPSASGKVIRDIVLKCEKAEIKFKIIPGLHKILTGEIGIKHIRDVQPEDLLGRKTVEIDKKSISSFIKNKVVLVTGAGGTIGSELCREAVEFEPALLILYDHNENDTYFLELELKKRYPYLKFRTIIGDIKNIGLLKCTFSKYRPQIVFHSAAHKHVPLMEENPATAVENNIIGTRNFIYAAEHYGVESFVMISTDKAVNPTSIMGASKRIAEMMMQAKAKASRTKFMAVRFGNVIGSSGSVVPIFKRQIESGGPITVTHPKVKRFFMTANEAAQLVIQAGAIGAGGEIFILDMGEQINITELGKSLITLSGLEPGRDIEIEYIGLRPGEKMQEEILLEREHEKATKHDKIYVAEPDDFDSLKLQKDIKELERLVNLVAEDKIIEKLREMVPSYNPAGNGAARPK